MWKARGNVPAERCPAIERFTKDKVRELGAGEPVTCEQLRPDVAWEVLREQSTPEPTHKEAA